MKLYLDDVRHEPEGWFRCQTAWRCIEILKGGNVTELSLDHDLGSADVAGTGVDVLVWLLGAMQYGFKPPAKISVHSMNPVGRQRMMGLVEKIEKMHFVEGKAVLTE